MHISRYSCIEFAGATVRHHDGCYHAGEAVASAKLQRQRLFYLGKKIITEGTMGAGLTEQELRAQRLAGVLEERQVRTKQLSVELDQQLFNSFKAKTSFEGRSIKNVVETLVRRYLEGGGTL